MKAKYKKIMDRRNVLHEEQSEEEDKAKWIEAEHIRRAGLKRPPKKMKEWKYTASTGAMERGSKRGGIVFIRYQHEVLQPLFIPFMRALGPGYIAQEDNAGPHASRWNREYWAASAIELMTWPPNSPDLSAIECPWWALKVKQGKKGPIHGRKFLTAFWPKHWQSFPLKKLQRYVERIQGNIEWVIRCLGGNEYKEGTKSPVLEEAERDQLNRDIEEFL